jgi:GNAT superfamily N-acetyltransferase
MAAAMGFSCKSFRGQVDAVARHACIAIREVCRVLLLCSGGPGKVASVSIVGAVRRRFFTAPDGYARPDLSTLQRRHFRIMSHHSLLFSVRSVPAERVHPLRSVVLLDGHSESSRFHGDDEASTLHLAVYLNERIVAVSTICREALRGANSDTTSDTTSDTQWRLRGVAVESELRGQGLGRLLVKMCIDHAQKQGGQLVWCMARESARAFYESLEFTSTTPPFTLASHGDIRFYEMHHALRHILPGGHGTRAIP